MKKDHFVKILTCFLKLWITFGENVLSYHYPMRKSIQLIRPRRLSSLFQTRIFREFSQKWKMEKETGVMPLQR